MVRQLRAGYILGGSPCSGKSTLAEKLAAEFGLPYYKVDDYEAEHVRRRDPERHPVMQRYSLMSWNEMWRQPVEQQVRDEFAYYRERSEMIGADLEKLDRGQPILMEGAAFFPDLLAHYRVTPQRVVYLVPTKEFQLRFYSQRPWIHEILKECADPALAFENWMERDHLFGQEVLRQAKAHGYRGIEVDGSLDVEALYAQIREYFGLAGGTGD